MAIEIIILAAGKGKRMHSNLPKVLHPIAGKPMLQHLLETTAKLKPRQTHIIVGHGKDTVIEKIQSLDCKAIDDQKINWVEQAEQKGTAHAVMQAMPVVKNDSTVLILNGDVPFISIDTLEQVCNGGGKLNLLTALVDDPTGMGRIIRDADGQVTRIAEEGEASAAEKQINEINSNCISAAAKDFSKWLPEIECNNSQKEYYLTEVVGCAKNHGAEVMGIPCENVDETFGVNSKQDLSKLERMYQSRMAEQIMSDGVTLLDSARFDLRGTCQFGNDCTVDINVILEGDVKFGNNVYIGPNTLIRNSSIGDDCMIESNSVIDTAVIGNSCNIGPFARIRPDTILSDQVRIGNFVEIKKSTIQENSKVNHLSYVGDSEVGENVNIGAGVITCNYDGANKHKTTIGNDVFVGSDSQLIAPVEIGDGATIGAGSTITDNVAEKSLAVSRSKQRSIENWKRPKKKRK